MRIVTSKMLFLIVTLLISTFFNTVAFQKTWVSQNPDDIRFFLYWNPGNTLQADELIHLDVNSIQNSNYDPRKSIKMYSSGFLQNYTSDQRIKNAYLEAGFTNAWNIILVDWGELSGNRIQQMNQKFSTLAIAPIYVSVVQNVEVVGKRISDFLVFLYVNNFIPTGASGVHLLGQSLGSHVMGVAGRQFQQAMGFQIQRITGTDPAGPLFQFKPSAKRLDESDAVFVDALHTNQGMAGYIGRLGHADTFINGDGLVQFQPACLPLILQQPFCSHNVAVAFYAKSIKQGGLQATRCNPNYPFVPGLLCKLAGRQELIGFGESTPNR